jgi:hypothetical protein
MSGEKVEKFVDGGPMPAILAQFQALQRENDRLEAELQEDREHVAEIVEFADRAAQALRPFAERWLELVRAGGPPSNLGTVPFAAVTVKKAWEALAHVRPLSERVAALRAAAQAAVEEAPKDPPAVRVGKMKWDAAALLMGGDDELEGLLLEADRCNGAPALEPVLVRRDS